MLLLVAVAREEDVLLAALRQLVIILNGMLGDGTPWRATQIRLTSQAGR
jgi:hypothetical protein